MTRRFSRLLLTTIAALLAGCSFRAPQVEFLLNAFDDSSVEDEIRALAWTLEWVGESIEVYPVVVDDLFVFTNPSDIQVRYDGLQVVAAIDLLPRGRDIEIRLSEEGTRMAFVERDATVLATACEPWERIPTSDGGRIMAQRCADLERPNRIVVDGAGETQSLEFSIHPDYPPLVLTRGAP